MIRVKFNLPDYYDEDNILQDGTQIIDVHNDKELQKILKDVYDANQIDHVHLEFGSYNKLGNFVYRGEITIPFKKGIVPYILL